MKSAQLKTSTLRRHQSRRVATESVMSASRLARRVGFTLVELLMVIVIIGILVSMLAVAINPVLTRTYEFAVVSEMKQLDLAIEGFKNKYGFYPPSFFGFPRSVVADLNDVDASNGAVDAGEENVLLPYLNKISPNHRELSPMFPGVSGSPSRLRVWWVAIGRHLDDRGSLVFWLNGLSKNKQFPITGGLPLVGGSAQLPVIFNADLAIRVDAGSNRQTAGGNQEFDITGTFERESRYDFRGGQLSNEFFDFTTSSLIIAASGTRVYNSPYGNGKFDLAYRYRNAAFYDIPGGTATDAFHVNTDGGPVFLNPGKFQLSTFGLDGLASSFATSAINKPTTGTGPQRSEWTATSNDNISNFANGRLDSFDWTEAVELGGKNPQ